MKTRAMGFYHSDGFTAAYNQASKWVGKNGKIATLPDIIEARLNHGKGSVVWNRYYTTLSAEYVGFSREGKRLIVVAHGIGPMSTLEGIQKVYSWEYKDKTRSRRGGRIIQEEFWDLIDGKYGKVEIVDFDQYVTSTKYPFINADPVNIAKKNPLLHARFGENTDAFINKVAQISQEWHRKEAKLDISYNYKIPSDNEEYKEKMIHYLFTNNTNNTNNIEKMQPHSTEFLKELGEYKTRFFDMWGYYLDNDIAELKVGQQLYGWDVERLLHIVAGAENSNSTMFEVSGASNCPYGYDCVKFDRDNSDIWKLCLEEGYAYAHLLSTGSLDKINRGGLIDVNIDVGCFEWSNGVRLAGLRHDYDAENDYIQDGPDANQLLEDHWNKCMVEAIPTNDSGMNGIMKFNDEWFTMVPKKGECMDTHIPEYHVETIKLISSATFRTTAGYQGDPFFRFSINEMSKIAPINANAYYLSGHPEVIQRGGNLPPFHDCEVEFYKITIDSSQRLMTASQLEKNLDKMLELMALE